MSTYVVKTSHCLCPHNQPSTHPTAEENIIFDKLKPLTDVKSASKVAQKTLAELVPLFADKSNQNVIESNFEKIVKILEHLLSEK